MSHRHQTDADQLFRHIAIVREMMLAIPYYEESHWLAAAVSFRELCHSPLAQNSLRRAATIAWQFGFADVSHWINGEVLANVMPDVAQSTGTAPAQRSLRLPPAPDFA